MDLSALDTFIAAPLAPIAGVMLFWSIQILLAEVMKKSLRSIWENHRAFCRFSNFVALFFQAISHAFGYTITGIGVAEFSVGVKDARVLPKKEKKGFPSFLAGGFLLFGPFFLPPLIVFLIFLPFMPELYIMDCYTFSSGLISFGSLLQQMGYNFVVFLLNLDLLNPYHLIFLTIFLLVGLGIRPSFIQQEERTYSFIEDLKEIKNFVLSHPKFILFIFLFLYAVYYILYLLKLPYYSLLFAFFGYLSVISILSLISATILIFLIMVSDKLSSFKRYLPLIIFVVSYAALRALLTIIKSNLSIPVANFVSISITIILSIFLVRRESNKLKMYESIAKNREERDEDRE